VKLTKSKIIKKQLFNIFDDRENDQDCNKLPQIMFGYHLKQYFRKSQAIPGSRLKNETTGEQKNGGRNVPPPVAIRVKVK